jgi:protein TonB
MPVRKSDKANLRQWYPIYVQIGAVLTLLILIGFTRADFSPEAEFEAVVEEQEVVQMEEIQQTKQEVKPPPPPKPPVPVEVPNDEIIEDEDVDFDASLDLSESLDTSQGPPPPDTGGEEEEEEPEIFVVVEQQPQMIGGQQALYKEISYPDFARKANIEGQVILQFVVDENGNVSAVQVLRGVHKLLDEEAVRAIKKMKFKPGKQRGQSVKVRMTQPVRFRLE